MAQEVRVQRLRTVVEGQSTSFHRRNCQRILCATQAAWTNRNQRKQQNRLVLTLHTAGRHSLPWEERGVGTRGKCELRPSSTPALAVASISSGGKLLRAC